MPLTIPSLIARIGSVLQPISHKSEDHPDTIDELYKKTTHLILEAAEALINNDHSKWRDARKDFIIGPNAHVMGVLKDIHKITTERQAFKFKYQEMNSDKVTEKTLSQTDVEILMEFFDREEEARKHEADRRNQETTE